MPGHFEPLHGGGAAVALDDVEISIIRSLAVQLLELIGPGPGEDASDDPLAELFAEGPRAAARRPGAPAPVPGRLHRPGAGPRLPAGRGGTDGALRRVPPLHRERPARGQAGERPRGGPHPGRADPGGDGGAILKLTAEESRQWLGALNDLRLAIGSRLDITDEDDTDDLYRLPDEDPRKPMVMAYLWLGGLQETLVSTLMR